jgi:hypothetical protein
MLLVVLALVGMCLKPTIYRYCTGSKGQTEHFTWWNASRIYAITSHI